MINFNIFGRLFLIVLIFLLALLSFQKNMYFSFSFLSIILIGLFINVYTYINNFNALYNKVVLAVLNKDYSASFQTNKKDKTLQNLIKLYNESKENHHTLTTKDTIYTSIFNQMKTGIMVIKINQSNKNILFMNDYFYNHFNVPIVSNFSNLKLLFPSFCDYLENINFQNFKSSIDIQTKNKGVQTYSLNVNTSEIFQHQYVTILLDSIQSVVEKKEKASWINLMKVISHELFNSLTPIHSLTENMIERTASKSLNDEDWEDLHLSLTTISNRSKHLKQFIESYRKLTALQSPIKTLSNVNMIVEQTLFLLKDKLKNITVKTQLDAKIPILFDQQQIEQVLVNLILNSTYALSKQDYKSLFITTFEDNNRTHIVFSDNGIGVDNAIKDKIFLPFFTTRKDGIGIGLTFSKSIVEAHGGYLFFEEKQGKTNFVMVL